MILRAVVDTNVLVRALIRPQGSVGRVLEKLTDRNFTLLYSMPLLDELVDVLGRPHLRTKYHLSDEIVKDALRAILLFGEEVVPGRRIQACRDAKDDMVLEAAVNGGADVIVSTDDDLIVLSPFEGIPVLAPGEFLARLESR
jgi:putative PIN family toxin of toxin-antitoxin system